MNSQRDILGLAGLTLQAANLLFNNRFYDDAFYLAGYCIELLLKAKICKTLAIDNFFEDEFLKSAIKNPQTFKSHDVNQLLILSGLYPHHEKQLADYPPFKTHWSLVEDWHEAQRYTTGKNKNEVENFLISVTEVSQWIKLHL